MDGNVKCCPCCSECGVSNEVMPLIIDSMLAPCIMSVLPPNRSSGVCKSCESTVMLEVSRSNPVASTISGLEPLCCGDSTITEFTVFSDCSLTVIAKCDSLAAFDVDELSARSANIGAFNESSSFPEISVCRYGDFKLPGIGGLIRFDFLGNGGGGDVDVSDGVVIRVTCGEACDCEVIDCDVSPESECIACFCLPALCGVVFGFFFLLEPFLWSLRRRLRSSLFLTCIHGLLLRRTCLPPPNSSSDSPSSDSEDDEESEANSKSESSPEILSLFLSMSSSSSSISRNGLLLLLLLLAELEFVSVCF
mmetsp:Transcript_56853/g.90580  ORF Transcript_56853/g.90580 Transcript_56853/m.90580 type:complete len:307 (-) Transcript_56853:687-1607(-)